MFESFEKGPQISIGSYWTQYVKTWGKVEKYIMRCTEINKYAYIFSTLTFYEGDKPSPITQKEITYTNWDQKLFAKLCAPKSKLQYDNAEFGDTLQNLISYARPSTDREIEKFLRSERARNARKMGTRFDL